MHEGYYDDLLFQRVPLCSDFYCNLNRTIWECLPTSCQRGYWFLVSMYALLAVMIIVANLTVLMVYLKRLTRRKGIVLARSQVYYKISLACADMLMGLVVCPCFIVIFGINFFSLSTWRRLVDGNAVGWYVEGSYFSPPEGDPYHNFYNFAGSVNMISIMVSSLTLLVASADRLFAISFPNRYAGARGCGSRIVAIAAILGTWIIGILFGIMPYYNPRIHYGGWTMIVIVSNIDNLIALYLTMGLIVLALLGMWTLNIITFISIKRLMSVPEENRSMASLRLHRVESQQLTGLETVDNEESCISEENDVVDRQWKLDKNPTKLERIGREHSNLREDQDRRLAITVAVIVGAFTLSFLPMLIALILGAVAVKFEGSDLSGGLHDTMVVCLGVLLMSNSFWNCIIYSVRHIEFRSEAKEIYTALYRKVTEMLCHHMLLK